jgi:hypothetical protein
MHFIAQCPYERREEDENNNKNKDKTYTKDKKDKKYYKNGPTVKLILEEWDSNDENSNSDSEDMATITIKGNYYSSKSLFSNLSKHTCLMAKETKK